MNLSPTPPVDPAQPLRSVGRRRRAGWPGGCVVPVLVKVLVTVLVTVVLTVLFTVLVTALPTATVLRAQEPVTGPLAGPAGGDRSAASARVDSLELRWWAEDTPGGVFDQAVTSDGLVWAATGSGLLRLDGAETVRFVPGFESHSGLSPAAGAKSGDTDDPGPPAIPVRAVEPDASGALVVALDDGAYRFEGRRFVLLSRPGVGGRSWAARDLFLDQDRVLWVAASDTLLRLDPGAFSLRQGLPGVTVNLLWEDPFGYLWATAESGQIFRRLGNAFQPVNFPLGMGDRRVQCLHLDAEGYLWLVRSDGAWRIDGDFAGAGLPRSAVPMPQFQDLALRTCRSEPGGGLWLGTERGLLYHAPDGSRAAVPGIDGAVRSIHPTSQGGLWVGTERGLAHLLDPAAPVPLPRVLVTSAAVDGKEVAVGPRFELPSGADELGLTLSAPSFRRPGEIRIRYRLSEPNEEAEGGDWKELGGSLLLLDRLPAGESVLTLQAGVGDVWNDTGTEVRIHREPALWQTRVFWAAVGAGLGALAVWLLYLRWAGPGPSPLEVPHEIDDDIVHLEDLDTDELRVSQETVDRARRNIFRDPPDESPGDDR